MCPLAVYVDGISLSSSDPDLLKSKFNELTQAVQDGGFGLNAGKPVNPAPSMTVFNCSLSPGETAVMPERIADFVSNAPTADSLAGFERYRLSVERGNTR